MRKLSLDEELLHALISLTLLAVFSSMSRMPGSCGPARQLYADRKLFVCPAVRLYKGQKLCGKFYKFVTGIALTRKKKTHRKHEFRPGAAAGSGVYDWRLSGQERAGMCVTMNCRDGRARDCEWINIYRTTAFQVIQGRNPFLTIDDLCHPAPASGDHPCRRNG